MADSPHQGTAPAPAPPVVLAPNLESELTCSICTDLLYQPLTLLDCLHTFCGACLKSWFHFQAARAESAPGPPPPPGTAVFTCPSCRERVRDTRHDARVVSLLDVFVALNPGRGRTEAEKRELDARYTRGERVLPRLSFEDRPEEERRADEEERRLIEEVQREEEGGKRRAGVEVDGDAGRRRRSESRQRERRPAGGEQRHVEHQSSLRNLISSHGMDARDIEREIEEFARQIQEEGLLDGVDLDSIDLENNDELSRKITEAYRRRHRERRRDGGRRSNASAHSHQSDASTRARSRTGDASRPTSRHTTHSRAPSASSNEERGRYPPSSSARLEVQEPSRRRRASTSGGRSATLPVVTVQPDVAVGTRAQTDLASRSGTTDSHVRRPSSGVDTRSSSSPTTVTAPASSRVDSPAARGLPFSARAAGGPGHPPSQPEAPSGVAAGRKRSDRPAALDLCPESPTPGSGSTPVTPALASPPHASARPQQLPRYREPAINCDRCSKEHIEYELHFNCAVCHNGEWNICLDCWRRRKGCLNWFGFGQAAWARWEKHNQTGPPIPPPHMLVGRRYLRPKHAAVAPDGRRALTTENPLDRLQSGVFCSRCAAWANDCYWRCDVCNDGEWGFCNSCVNQGNACSHPLLALAYHPPSSSPTTTTTSSSRSPASPNHHPDITNPASSSSAAAAAAGGGGTFQPLTFTPPCAGCRNPIPPSEPYYYHCPVCPSNLPHHSSSSSSSSPKPDDSLAPPAPPPGEYNLCETCYAALVGAGAVAAENGPDGWRRCPRGHRMVVVAFVPDEVGEGRGHNNNNNNNSSGGNGGGGGNGGVLRRRTVLRDLVGGRRLRVEDYHHHHHHPGQGGQGGGGEGSRAALRVCSWREEGSGRRVERVMTRDVADETEDGLEGGAFPPDGGTGCSAVAGWGWIPAEGVEDELMFPKGAEILEVEDVNGEWFHGFYMGAQGLFPAPYVRLVGKATTG
ncbi:6ac4f02c-0013-4a3f-986e-edbeefb94afd [Thermothielavioides terrestris]|uniref:6ac4f02c-0013-4a3f-986e-edbeefb94afd n=1 Tax=Thermothielavioides terrestris TaxID=2587410 RepID=A0A446BU48_9PEZI|nr:6ac4f02c-0013-4a3f-986e-edbeefb94afd [Thermothielavioides terrestris]